MYLRIKFIFNNNWQILNLITLIFKIRLLKNVTNSSFKFFAELDKSSADVAAEGAILNEMLEIVAKRAALRPNDSLTENFHNDEVSALNIVVDQSAQNKWWRLFTVCVILVAFVMLIAKLHSFIYNHPVCLDWLMHPSVLHVFKSRKRKSFLCVLLFEQCMECPRRSPVSWHCLFSIAHFCKLYIFSKVCLFFIVMK